MPKPKKPAGPAFAIRKKPHKSLASGTPVFESPTRLPGKPVLATRTGSDGKRIYVHKASPRDILRRNFVFESSSLIKGVKAFESFSRLRYIEVLGTRRAPDGRTIYIHPASIKRN